MFQGTVEPVDLDPVGGCVGRSWVCVEAMAASI